MKLLNKLERKLGRYAIPNLINYVIVLYGLGAFLGMMDPSIYLNLFMLDVEKILHGQVWRLFTFILEPFGINGPLDVLLLALTMYLYYLFGHSLENAWGAFRFNLYFFSGVLLNILAAFIVYFIAGWFYPVGLQYIYQSMFFAFAALYPNMQFLLFFIIPLKVKYLAYLDALLLIYSMFQYVKGGRYYFAIAILVGLANFLIFFFMTRNYKKISPKMKKRTIKYKREMQSAAEGARHKCAICGRTEEDDENLEFRYCSKCEGNYEYCSDHLFTHQHIHK